VLRQRCGHKAFIALTSAPASGTAPVYPLFYFVRFAELPAARPPAVLSELSKAGYPFPSGTKTNPSLATYNYPMMHTHTHFHPSCTTLLGRVSRSDSGDKYKSTRHLRLPGPLSTNRASHTPLVSVLSAQENSAYFDLLESCSIYTLSSPWGGAKAEALPLLVVPPYHTVRGLNLPDPRVTAALIPDSPASTPFASASTTRPGVRAMHVTVHTPRPPQSYSRNLFVFG